MTRLFLRSAAIAGILTFASSHAFAQQEVRCRAEISATGSAALTESGAKEKAIGNWRRSVIARYGEFFSNFEKARGSSVSRCAKTLLGLTRCEARGQPCEAGLTTANEISCDRDDSANCSPTVKWIQTRLNAKGARLKVDGAEGEATRQALRKFKQTNGLGDDSDVTEKVLQALAA